MPPGVKSYKAGNERRGSAQAALLGGASSDAQRTSGGAARRHSHKPRFVVLMLPNQRLDVELFKTDQSIIRI
jgi:hypothetical protein